MLSISKFLLSSFISLSVSYLSVFPVSLGLSVFVLDSWFLCLLLSGLYLYFSFFFSDISPSISVSLTPLSLIVCLSFLFSLAHICLSASVSLLFCLCISLSRSYLLSIFWCLYFSLPLHLCVYVWLSVILRVPICFPLYLCLLVSSSQAARHSHVAVAWAGSLVLMGGELADGSLTSDVWAFSPLGGGHWELLAPPVSSSSGPPGLAGHAAALVDDVWLYVSGGRTQHDLFSSGLFRFRLDRTGGAYWEQVIPAGGRPPAATGHSMVFHAPSRALLVHGGHRPSTAR